jgi:hypothetical protein
MKDLKQALEKIRKLKEELAKKRDELRTVVSDVLDILNSMCDCGGSGKCEACKLLAKAWAVGVENRVGERNWADTHRAGDDEEGVEECGAPGRYEKSKLEARSTRRDLSCTKPKGHDGPHLDVVRNDLTYEWPEA